MELAGWNLEIATNLVVDGSLLLMKSIFSAIVIFLSLKF